MKKMITVLYDDKRVRFFVVGSINTAISFMIYSLLVMLNVTPHIAIVIMYPISILNSYLGHKKFTFQSVRYSKQEAIRFIIICLFGISINYSIVYIATNVFLVNPYLAGLAAMATTTVVSYLGHSMFSFRD